MTDELSTAAHLPKFTYYVGETAYKTHLPAMNGAMIKARIPDLAADAVLTLEDDDDTKPNRVIHDHDVVQIALRERHFIVAPPATFGDALGPITKQLERLRNQVASAVATVVPGAGTLIAVPGVVLPAGWNKAQTDVWFLLQDNYPYAQPDCFFAEADLRLANDQIPQNAGMQAVPGLVGERLWFSWHVGRWNAATDNLATWLAVIRNRFAEVR